MIKTTEQFLFKFLSDSNKFRVPTEFEKYVSSGFSYEILTRAEPLNEKQNLV